MWVTNDEPNIIIVLGNEKISNKTLRTINFI